MKRMLQQLWQDQKGQDLTEYALLLVLIALVCIAAIQTLGSAVENVFSNAAANVSAT